MSFTTKMNHHIATQNWSELINWPLLTSIFMLMSFGLVMVTSASMSFAEFTYGDAWYFSKRHCIYLIIGCCCGVLVAAMPPSFWERFGSYFLVLALILLTVVMISWIGHSVNGSRRWLKFGPLTLQASELAKFCMIIFFSSFLSRRGLDVIGSWQGLIKPLMILSVVVFLLLLEPDFGTSVVLSAMVIAMLFIAGVKLWRFILLMVASLSGLALVVYFSPYRMQRLITFMDPWSEQFTSGYQLTQSLIAFGRGEWFGLGLGNSVQKLLFLPEAHTDFIFSIIAEEFGLMGITVLLVLFTFMIAKIFTVSQRAMSLGAYFTGFVAFGVAVLLAGQGFINVGVASGLLPTKGLTMPLISYGGSSLLTTCAMLGLVLRLDFEISRQILLKTQESPKKNRQNKMTPIEQLEANYAN